MVKLWNLFLTAAKFNKFVIKLLINSHALTFVPDCFITQKMCDKTVNTYLPAMQFVHDCYKTQEM